MKQLLLFILLAIPAYSYAQVRDIETDSTIIEIKGSDTTIIEKPTFGPEYKGKFKYVEHMPYFKGDLKNYLQQHLHYPEDARQKKIEGSVVVRFTIDADGSIHDPIILRSVYPSIDTEAIHIVQNMPDWQPAILHEQPIKTDFSLAIPFKL